MQSTTESPTSTGVKRMEIRYTCNSQHMKKMDTSELRHMFLAEDLFVSSELRMIYTDVDRAIIGGAIPTDTPLSLVGSKELAADSFCERREVGLFNVGGPGVITVDGERRELEKCDCLYVGRGAREISLESKDPGTPAAFYILSYPAHKNLPVALIRKSTVEPVHLGSKETCNERLLHKYIHPDGIKSCQLTMGFTQIAPGSVWNTMPPHTHERRSEIYLYFDIPEEHTVVHLMGTPTETRHLMIHNRQAAISPSWSIHSGAGTSNYSFIWGMGGENQRFDDMDGVEIPNLR